MNEHLPNPVTPAPSGNPRSPIRLSTVDCSPNPATAVGLPWQSLHPPRIEQSGLWSCLLAKKVGSLVIWLKSKLAAEHLLQSGTAIFGATGAYCSKWERREDNLPCFNCNKYGHKQASCTAAPKCALCSGKHSRLKCPRPTELCCPACNKEGHSVFDWKCKLHPNHWKYAGIQKAAAARPTQQVEVQAPKLVKAAGPARQRPVSPVVPVDVQDTTAIRSNNGSETTEHEVDMTDAAETTGSNE
jgi:hypothetical protein